MQRYNAKILGAWLKSLFIFEKHDSTMNKKTLLFLISATGQVNVSFLFIN